MRFGRPFLLLALVLLSCAVPATAAAEPARLSSTEAEGLPTPLVEHRLLTEKAEDVQPKPRGRPRVVAIALRYLGTPYRWAGSSPGGFDCSGFVMYVYGRIGIGLPHNTAMLWGLGRPVARKDLQPGDLVFFNGLGHSGIYIGGGRFVHSPHSGDVVKITRLSESPYRTTYYGARRL
jgi:cell wall-associated NlpC family hydrolase